MRESRNLSQATVAQQLGISQSSYNDLEQGRTKLKAEALPLLAQSLQVEICYFFEPTDTYPNHNTHSLDKVNVPDKQYSLLQKENEKIISLIYEQRKFYEIYQQKSEELMSDMRRRHRIKDFLIRVLLLSNIATSIIIVYFEELSLWILSIIR